MERTIKKMPFVFYDAEQIKAFLPDMRQDIWELRHGRGRHEAMRSDYIRNKVLYKWHCR